MTTKSRAQPSPSKDSTDKPTALWTSYRVRWTLLTNLCASIPADPAIIQKWIESRQPRVKPAEARSIEEINEEVVASLERGDEEQEFSMLVFQSYAGSLVVRAATIKAHLKDCARQLYGLYIGKIEGEKAFFNRVANGIYLPKTEYWIPIHRPDGTLIREADGAYDKPIHVYVPNRGSMHALKRFEYIAPPAILEFTINVLGHAVRESDLHHLFEYGGTHGYAGERGAGEGRYDYTFNRIAAED